MGDWSSRFCLFCLSKDPKSLFNDFLGTLFKGLSLPVRMKDLLLLPRQPTGAESCNTFQNPALKPLLPWWYHCTDRRAGGQTEEGHHDLAGQQLHDTERWLWEKLNTWASKPAEQDSKQWFYLRQVPRSMSSKLVLFLSPQTLLLELPLPIRCLVVYFTSLPPQSNWSAKSRTASTVPAHYKRWPTCSFHKRGILLRGVSSHLTVPIH